MNSSYSQNIQRQARRTKQHTNAIVTFFLSLVALCSHAQTERNYETSLKDVSNQIKTISKKLNANRSRLEKEQTELLRIDQKINNINNNLRKNREKIEALNSSISVLEDEQAVMRLQQNQSRASLAELINSHYKNGVPNQLKRILNQEDPYAVGRLNNYQAYFSQAIRERFDELQLQMAATKQLRAQQKQKIIDLQNIEQEQEFLKKQHETQLSQRKRAIKRLDERVSADEQRLKKLQADRNRLNTLLTQLKKQKEELARIERERAEVERLAAEKARREGKKLPDKKVIRPLVKGGFIKQKGRLQCPVSLTATTKFGQRIVSSGMRSEGVFYDTKVSVPLKSIFRGRVLFADFLKGFGLLLIVDHGDDHISLYGHNEVIYKKVGDDVDTNEVIAKTGTTGGLKSPGLYFEIRNNTTPINPATWCQ